MKSIYKRISELLIRPTDQPAYLQEIYEELEQRLNVLRHVTLLLNIFY